MNSKPLSMGEHKLLDDLYIGLTSDHYNVHVAFDDQVWGG